MSEHFDPTPASAEIAAATARLLDTARSLSDADVSGPSLLPGWSRGHVLTHVARSADGLANLLVGAAEGAERKAYPGGPGARNADIDAGSRRPVDEQVADIEAAHERFVAAVAAVPAAQWSFPTPRSGGKTRPASDLLNARLREVAVHHIDLDFGYTAADWPPELALRILRLVLPAFEERGLAPCTMRPADADAGAVVRANGGSGLEISGPTYALATWLLGRDSGTTLSVAGGVLPTPPAW